MIPVAAWQALGRRQAGLVEFMTGVSEVRIEGDGTDMTLSVKGRTWINSDGRRNMPSGEIFTGPVETSARGKLRCSFPVCRGGRELVGIALEFLDGKVVAAKADDGEDYLLSMLDLDPGARFLGELGIGLNAGSTASPAASSMTRRSVGPFTWRSAAAIRRPAASTSRRLHWDLILDLRAGGRVTADGTRCDGRRPVARGMTLLALRLP